MRARDAEGALRTLIAVAVALGSGLLPGAALAEAPMSYLESAGARGKEIAVLNWALSIQSIVVVVIVSGLVLVGVLVRRSRGPAAVNQRLPVLHGGNGVKWMYIGLAITTIALVGSVTWTMVTMAAISHPPEEPRLTIEITGHQWWWEVNYVGEDPRRSFETANEIHIPVGEPVRLKLASADVIHSFWVPALSGKTDLIPGQVNVTWIQADEAGVFRGQCAEFCGRQHSHMALFVFAQPAEEFEAWWEEQLEPAAQPEGEVALAGQQQFVLRCAVCHTVRGTIAGGEVGPDLTHLMARETIASGMLPNNVGHLSGWVANPQFIKPASKMPNLELSGPQLDAIRAYLLTLD